MTIQRFAPDFDDAIGDRSGGRVRLRTSTLEPYEYISCEHPEELLVWFRRFGTNTWVPCDSGALLNTRHIVKVEVEE